MFLGNFSLGKECRLCCKCLRKMHTSPELESKVALDNSTSNISPGWVKAATGKNCFTLRDSVTHCLQNISKRQFKKNNEINYHFTIINADSGVPGRCRRTHHHNRWWQPCECHCPWRQTPQSLSGAGARSWRWRPWVCVRLTRACVFVFSQVSDK